MSKFADWVVIGDTSDANTNALAFLTGRRSAAGPASASTVGTANVSDSWEFGIRARYRLQRND
jgi:hypothetical protein